MTDAFDRLKAALADRYAIEREIGAGGMATVYLAHDLKHDRKVAVKVLRPALAASIGVDRFLREINIAANLNHPHILPLHDSGEAEGFLFYVMPYVQGESLKERLNREKQLPIDDALNIAAEVADALGFAHQHNVIHRDIKPENILLEAKHAVVADFGVARAIEEAEETKLTETGVAIGTPAYLSPEQAAGERELDGRCDIYALGCVLYEMLAGLPPFTGPTVESVVRQHLAAEPKSVMAVRPTVPSQLEGVVSRALAKSPADRHQSAELLGEAIAAVQMSLATPSSGVSLTGTTSVDRATKRRWMMAGGAVAVAAIVVVIVVMAAIPRGSGVALDPNHVVVAVFRNATGDPSLDQLGERIGQWITLGLQEAEIPASPWDIALQSSQYVQTEITAGRMQNPVRAMAEETGAGVVISGTIYSIEGDSLEVQVNVTDARRGRILGTVDPIRCSRNASTEAIAATRQQVMGLLAVSFDERLVSAELMGSPPTFEAYQAFMEGFRLQLGVSQEEAIPYFKQAAELDTSWAPPLIRLAVAFRNLDRIAELDSVLRVLEERVDKLTPYHRARVQYYRARYNADFETALVVARKAAELAPGSPAVYNRAFMAMHRNRPREAIEALRTLDIERGWIRDAGPGTYWYVMVHSLNMLGEHQQALEAAQRAYQLHPDGGALVLSLQAVSLAALGRFDELNSLLNEIESQRDLRWVHNAFVWSVEALRRYGYIDAAQRVTERAVRWFETRPPNEVNEVHHRRYYGRILFQAGRHEESQAVFDALVDDMPDDWGIRVNRAFIAASRRDINRARADEAWFEAAESHEGRHLHAWYELGVIAGALGESQRAVELLREADRHGIISNYPFFQTHMHFAPLRDHPPFQELMRPKG